jgi:hypothetical protein
MHGSAAGIAFENSDWTVSPAGLEHKGTGYLIERELLGARRTDGLWDWPLHMLEKTWCAPGDFAEAFGAALLVHGVAPDAGLAASFAAALEPEPLRDPPWPRRRASPDVAAAPARRRIRISCT